ncbi:MAG: hypothetical protein EA402_10925, partial [Planctomycetota bacterium]
VEIAALADIPLPQGLRHRLEQGIARQLPPNAADPGRLGLAAFARQIRGAGHAMSTGNQLSRLMQQIPGSDADERLDVMAWYFPTLALRETRDRRWRRWNDGLEKTLITAMHSGSNGEVWLPGSRVRYAQSFGPAADLMATAMAVLNLQASYRYLPLRG